MKAKLKIIGSLLIIILTRQVYSQFPNTISIDPNAGKEIGGITGIVIGPTNNLVQGAVIIVTDANMTTVFGEMVSYGKNAEYSIDLLPASTKLLLFSYHESIPSSLFYQEFQLSSHEVKKLNIILPMPGGAAIPKNIAEVILRGQYTDYVSGMKAILNRLKSPTETAYKRIYDANDHLLTAQSDLGSFTFTDARGTTMVMSAIVGLGNDPVAFARTFENVGSLKDIKQRKKIYKEVIYEIVFQNELEELNLIELYNGYTTNDNFLTALSNIFGATSKASSVTIALAEFLSEDKLNLLAYIPGSNSFTVFLNKLKSAGRNVRKGSLTNYSRVLDELSVITGTIRFVKSGWVITSKALLLKAAQFDLAAVRLEELATNSTIRDEAFNQAINEIRIELKNPPSDFFDKILASISHNKEAVNDGLFGLADAVTAGAGLAMGTATAHIASAWAGSILFAMDTYDGIQTWEDNLQAASVAATLYTNLIENKDVTPDFESAELVEYSEILFYSKMSEVLNKGYLKVYELFRPSQREVRNYIEDEYRNLIINVAKKRLYWYKSTFKESPIKNEAKATLGFILDSSGSMKDSDPNNIRKEATDQIINRLSGNENFFLIDFDGSAYWRNSDNWSNWNREKLKAEVRKIDSDGGTNVGAGISTLRQAFEANLSDYSKATVVLLSDGMGNYNHEAEWFAQNGIKIYTVSYKDKADANLLNSIASSTGGLYIQANNESDVVVAFMQFYNDLQGMSKFTSVRGGFGGQSSINLPAFHVDQNCSNMTASFNWTGANKSLDLYSPSGKIYSSTATASSGNSDGILYYQKLLAVNYSEKLHGPDASYGPETDHPITTMAGTNVEWVRGKNYTMAKITSPEPGEWKAALKSLGSVPSNDTYLFEAMGNSDRDIELKTARTAGNYSYNMVESAPDLLWESSRAVIALNSPTGKTIDISNNYKKGSFYFYPADGKGNYQIEASVWVNDTHNQVYQRHFTRSELVGEILPGYLAPVKEIMGLFIVTDQGNFTGNRAGIKCFVYAAGGSSASPKATGYVTHVNDKECTIRIVDLKSGKIEQGDIVELDMQQWQNDKSN